MPDEDDPKIIVVNDYMEIPEIFHSDATGQPIKNCIMCGIGLGDHGTPYVIEKAFRHHKKFNQTDTLFEYAVCFDCYEKMSVSLSKDSMAKLQSFFSKHIDLEQRRKTLLEKDEIEIGDWLDHCVITGKEIKECAEYQICAQCDGPHLLFTHLPFALSEEALLEMSEQLSAKTKEELDRFQDDFLGLPPELKELFKDRRPVFV